MTRAASIRRWSGSRGFGLEKLNTPTVRPSDTAAKAKPPRMPVPSASDFSRTRASLRVLVELEVAAADPVLGLAHRADHLDQAAGAELGRGKHARHPVLQAQQLLGAFLRGDLAPDAAIAGELAVGAKDRLAAHFHVAQAAVAKLAPHQEVVEGCSRLEDRAMRFPAAFDLEPALPALLAEKPGPQRLVATGDLASLEPREPVLGVLLPVPVGSEMGQAAEARLGLAHRLLGSRALQELTDHAGDDMQRLVQPLVRRAHAPAGDVEHRTDTAAAPDREQHCSIKAGARGKPGAHRARVAP